MTIRVLLADDEALLRTGFAVLLESAPGLEVVGQAATGTEAIRLARQTRADVVLMDIRMPDLDGLTATRMICADEDLAGVHVLILTTFEVEEYVFEALRAGASGFLGKNVELDDLVRAIQTVARGDALLSPPATRALIGRFLAKPGKASPIGPDRLAVLTSREREVLERVGRGLSNDEIAREFVLSPATVKTHINRAMAKLNAHDRAQLVVIAYETGLVSR